MSQMRTADWGIPLCKLRRKKTWIKSTYHADTKCRHMCKTSPETPKSLCVCYADILQAMSFIFIDSTERKSMQLIVNKIDELIRKKYNVPNAQSYYEALWKLSDEDIITALNSEKTGFILVGTP